MSSFAANLRTATFVLLLPFVVLCCSGDSKLPKNFSDEKREGAANANLQLGIAYMQQGDLQRAHDKLQRALLFNSENADAHAMLGMLYTRSEEYEKAQRSYLLALKLNPSSSDIMNNYAQFLCRRGMPEKAQEYFLKAAENPLYAHPAVPYTNLALCLGKLGRDQQAEQFLRTALQHDGKMPVALLQMAQRKYNAGDLSAAQDYIDRYTGATLHTAKSLYLAIQIAQGLEDVQSASRHSLLLRKKFPDSDEAQLLDLSRNSP